MIDMNILYLDTETRSGTGISSGTFRYVEDEHFAVILFTWAINDADVECWQPLTEPMPEALREALTSDDFIYVIHNSMFDRRVINRAFGIDLPTDRIHDTMVQALAHGMPGALGTLSKIFALEGDGKLDTGKALIRLFCVPAKRKEPTDPVWFADPAMHPEQWEEFCEYAVRDVVAMRKLYKTMPSINYPAGSEHALWQYDQLMNDRGLLVDVDLANAALICADEEKEALRKKTKELTGGTVESASQTAAFLEFLQTEMNADISNLRSATLNKVLENPETSAELREAVALRIEMGRNAASKYRALVNSVDCESRLHDTIQFLGASRTGRDGGRTFQPQNLPRTTMWGDLEGADLIDGIQAAIDSTKALTLNMTYDKPLDVLGNLLRSVIMAPEGSKLAVADLSNIEGRSLVWLANEDWKLDYFRQFDSGAVKFDNYVAAYAKAMNIPPEQVKKSQRQIGKVMELGLGYGGGVAAFLTFAAVYRLDISELARAVAEVADPIVYAEAKDKFDWAKTNGYHAGLEQFEYTACEYLKMQWRAAHPQVCRFWKGLDSAFRQAITVPNAVISVDGTNGKVKMLGKKGWVLIRLPSGRSLCYFQPKISESGELSFMGVDGFTKRWSRIKTYSGKLAENVTSATARDVMFRRIPLIEENGYRIIMRVHDELVAEVPDEEGYNHHKLAEMMAMPHDWCADLPLAAAGFTGYRYRGKD